MAGGVSGGAAGAAPDRGGGEAAGVLRLGPIRADEFAARLDRLGPFEPRPTLALAVSGGADSMAMALLAAAWAAARGGSVAALAVDHGIQRQSAAVAAEAIGRLAERGIAGRIVTLAVPAGPRLAERARAARHDALEAACARAGILHLLFAHHAADQAETVAMRRLRGSGPDGLAGMAALAETDLVRKLRPLLDVPPVRLRDTLRAAGMSWFEDPANSDPRAQRVRLRMLARDRDGTGPLIAAAVAAATARGFARARAETETANWLGRHVSLFPTGHAIVSSTTIPPAALGALIATIGGAMRPPPQRQAAGWAANPRPATLGGVRIASCREGWRLTREAAAMRPAAPARDGERWDGRFIPAGPASGGPIGPGGPVEGAPSTAWRVAGATGGRPAWFAPNRPLTPGCFVPPLAGMQKPREHPILAD